VGWYGTKSINEVAAGYKKTYLIHGEYGVGLHVERHVEGEAHCSVLTPTTREFLEKLVVEQQVKKLLSFK
jgi:hypothetical protein